MIKTILITGKSGQLGQSFQKIALQNSELRTQYLFTFVGREQLDLTCPQSITDYFKDKHFDIIINCAAYTAVDKAETESEVADQINHLAVKQLAEISRLNNSFFVHVSTDYVFDGMSHKPYVETDHTNPINVYGLTKLKGEQAIQVSGCKGVIIRTSWVYSEFGNNFVKTMLRLGRERESLNVIYNQIGTPTYASDLARSIFVVLKKFADIDMVVSSKKQAIQIYHYSNEGVCSWYDFAKAIFEIGNVNCQVNPIDAKDYPTPAKRPFYSLMDKSNIKQISGLEVPYWRDNLALCLGQLK
ncbi:dTDP-4-dehydrorhamnose reductase [Rheinheimera pacifica]|uniref:dTDP-4-dehydrorhamnose reductase n=1 Tax=Rheinheimera pacifica TaxID=173990 RepID=UPI002ED9C9C5